MLIAGLSEPKLGLVTRRELRAAKVSVAAIDHRVKVGRLFVVFPGIYSVGHAPLTPESRAMAAVLTGGPVAGLGGAHAAAHWRLLSAAPGPIEVLHTGAHRRGPVGVSLRRTRTFELVIHRGVPVTTIARTLLDLATAGSIGRLEVAVDEAQVRKHIRRSELEALAWSGRRGSRAIRALLEDASGYTREGAERRLKALIVRAQLPRPRTNVHVEGFDADAFWPEHRLVVEVDGYAAHGRLNAFERDRRLDQRRTAAGYRTMRVTWRQLTCEPMAFVAALAAALARSAEQRPAREGSGQPPSGNHDVGRPGGADDQGGR